MNPLKANNFISSKLPDHVVVQRVLSGEKELYEILMRRNNQTLYRAIRSYLKIDADIQDIMQDTYYKAYKSLNQFKGEAKFSTWLIRIGINEALNKIRKDKKANTLSIHREDEVNSKIIQLPDSNKMNPEEQVINRDLKLLLEKAIDKIPEKYRLVYVLREVEGMDTSEVSKCLEIGESNVKVRFHRAKKLLKEELYKLSADTTIFKFGNTRCDRIVNLVMDSI